MQSQKLLQARQSRIAPGGLLATRVLSAPRRDYLLARSMTDVVTASTPMRDGAAGDDLATQIRAGLDGGVADAVIVFASSQNDYAALLDALQRRTGARALVGCSSAGEFTSDASGTGMTSAIALRSPKMRFRAALARNLSENRQTAAERLAQDFVGLESSEFRCRNALVLVDALAGHAEDLVDRLTLATGGLYRFFGGGANSRRRYQTNPSLLAVRTSPNGRRLGAAHVQMRFVSAEYWQV